MSRQKSFRESDTPEDVNEFGRPSTGLSGPLMGSISPAVKLQRHWLTGEWQEVPLESDSGRVYRVAGDREAPKVLRRRDYEKVHMGLSLLPEKATPARIAHENREARRHGTGAVYDRKGRCHISSRGSQNRELRRRKQLNPDAGYHDWAGR